MRLLKRLLRAFLPPKRVKKNIWVWSPLVIPAASSIISQYINRVLFSIGLSIYRTFYLFNSAVLWTYNPLTLLYVNHKSFKALIYHCVDEISAQPGMNELLIRAQEKQLCTLADHVFVTSPALYSSRSCWSSQVTYFPNVVDAKHFDEKNSTFNSMPYQYYSIPEPRIIFVGALSSYKVDFKLIKELALMRPHWSIILIGLVGEGDPKTSIDQLIDIENVYLLGPKPYNQLPGFMHASDIGILPCVLNTYTRAMFPMKFFEYLAAGLPVVSTRLPSLEEFSDYVDFADSVEEFASKIEIYLSKSVVLDEVKVKNFVSRYSYIGRTSKMIAIINQLLCRV